MGLLHYLCGFTEGDGLLGWVCATDCGGMPNTFQIVGFKIPAAVNVSSGNS
jgi:hypothetical protein